MQLRRDAVQCDHERRMYCEPSLTINIPQEQIEVLATHVHVYIFFSHHNRCK